MKDLQLRTVADLVTENIKTAHVFKKYGIDFCCGGGITIQKACEKANINYEELENDLLHVDSAVTGGHNYNSWPIEFLTDHIINIHHAYVAENIPLLLQYSNRVVKVHGHHYTELHEINDLFTIVAVELSDLMKKEEMIIIPCVKKRVTAKAEGSNLPQTHTGTGHNAMNMMAIGHE